MIDALEQAGLSGAMLDGPIQADCYWRFSRPKSHFGTGKNAKVLKSSAPRYHSKKPDRDNLDKAVLDAMTQAGVWRDDARAARGLLEKRYCNDGELPGVTIQMRELEP